MKVILFLIVSALAGCGSIKTENLNSKGVLIPLSIGNHWKYIELESENVYEAKVVESQLQNGRQWFKYIEFDDSFWMRNEGMVQIEPFFSMEKNLDLEGGEVIVLDATTSEAKKYTVNGAPVLYVPCEKPLTVPAGIFDCHRFEFTLEDGGKSINYYAVNVGLIKNEYTVKGVVSTRVLKEFSIK